MRTSIVIAAAALAACRQGASSADAGRLDQLRQTDKVLHDRVDAAVSDDPVVRQVLEAKDTDVVVAVRTTLTEHLLRSVTSCYLDQITLDLEDVEARAEGDLHRKTFLGDIKLGGWRVEIVIDRFRTRLKAGKPTLRILETNEIDLDIPVEAQEAAGRASIRFAWDSAGLADLVCRDFELISDIAARTPRQTHTIGGTFRVAAEADRMRVEPVSRRDTIRVKVDVTDDSWKTVEDALRTQDTVSRCGIGLDPPKVTARLKERVAEGFDVHLPKKIFRDMALPARFERSGQIDGRPVAISVRSKGFTVTPYAIWMRGSIAVDAAAASAAPGAQAPAAPPARPVP